MQVKLVAAQVGVNAKADQFYTFLFFWGGFLAFRHDSQRKLEQPAKSWGVLSKTSSEQEGLKYKNQFLAFP